MSDETLYDEHGNGWRRNDEDGTLYPVPDPAHFASGGNIPMADTLMAVFGYKRVDTRNEDGEG